MNRAKVILLALCAGGASGQDTALEAVDKATFRAICGTCHSTTLVNDLRTGEEWREEVDQMIKIGARVRIPTDADQRSDLMAIAIPNSRRSPFQSDGDHRSKPMPITRPLG